MGTGITTSTKSARKSAHQAQVKIVINNAQTSITTINSWIKIGTTSYKPLGFDCFAPVYDGSNGGLANAEGRVDTDGNIYVMIKEALTYNYLAFEFHYIVNET